MTLKTCRNGIRMIGYPETEDFLTILRDAWNPKLAGSHWHLVVAKSI